MVITKIFLRLYAAFFGFVVVYGSLIQKIGLRLKINNAQICYAVSQ